MIPYKAHLILDVLGVCFFGPRTLIEDRSQRSDPTTLVYLQLGYKFNDHWEVNFDVFNLLDSQDSDIDYYYTSRLPGNLQKASATSTLIRASYGSSAAA